jgi:uncharacterized membrane protein YphA (DoxX/SURF4 family)
MALFHLALASLAHERWFTPGRFAPYLEHPFAPETLIPVAIALGTTAVALVIWRARSRRSVVPGPVELGVQQQEVSEVLAWMPFVIGIHTAVPLLVAGVQRQLFVPNLTLPFHIVGGALGLAQILIALSFVYGFLTRIAGAALIVTWLAGAVLFGPLLLLEQALFLGIAFFLMVTGRGPMAVDMTIRRLQRPLEPLLPYGVPVLRVMTGVSLVVLAFTEKLWNLPLALAFLEQYPFNFMPAIGFPGVDDVLFIRMAGTVELTLGSLLISGAFPRLTILALWLPFNLTLPFLGWRELVGHLPIYGIMALLLIWGERRPATERAFIAGVRGHERN